MGPTCMTGAEALLATLRHGGVSRAFGIASGKLSPLFRALSEDAGWTYVGVRHEASAAFMATAIGAVMDAPAVCLGETGPGGANLLSALGGAFANNLPVVAITSSNPSYLVGPDRGAFSSSNNQALFGNVTKWSATVRDVGRIPELVRYALRVATTGRPGPVHLDVPAEILKASYAFDSAELSSAPGTYRPTAAFVPCVDQLRDATCMLAQAERPLLIGGGGVVRSGGAEAFRTLAQKLRAPAMTTQMGLGAIPADDPHCIGQGGILGGETVAYALRNADVVLAVGCRFSSFMWMEGPPVWSDGLKRKLIQIDIDPGMMGLNHPLTLGLVGDARATMESLLALLDERKALSPWTQDLAERRSAEARRLDALADEPALPMHPAVLAREVGRFVRPDDLAVFDGGHTSFWCNDFTPATLPATRFHEPGMGHLGFGLPWAIALALAHPDRRTFCLTGDGAFGFTIQELDTARRTGAAPIVVVHNNESWGVIRAGQDRAGFSFGTDLSGTDYAAIARGFGCYGETVASAAEVIPALQRAAASGVAAVIDARVRFDPHPVMPVFGMSTMVR